MMIVLDLMLSMHQAVIPEDTTQYVEAMKKYGIEINPDGPAKYELTKRSQVIDVLKLFMGELGWDDTVILTVSLPEHEED